ncbi:MAG: BamA/TamA family outer membrane protein [Bacteroidaceae bacterium]|nr:BamA/TamA family outer membrane protein [Bacteroidaceae bacterium]
MKRYLSFCIAMFVAIMSNAASATRDSIVVDSITGDVRKYKLTDNKALKPLYWVYNYLANSNKRRSDVSYDGGFVFGPAYNINTGFAIGGGYSALYSFDKNDPKLQKSIVNGFFQASVKGIVAIGVEGHNFLKGDKQRFNYEFSFTHYPSAFWGIGCDTSLDNFYANRMVSSKQLLLKLEGDYTWRLAKNLYFGPKIDFLYSYLYKTTDILPENEVMGEGKYEGYGNLMDYFLRLPDGSGSQPGSQLALGLGVTLTYDSRDFATNAYKGHYFNLQQLGFAPGINEYGFLTTDVKYQFYTPLWKKCTLAFQAHGRFNYGNDVIPWIRLASTGNQGMGRGYFYGQYRDNNVMETQLEFRQRLIWRLGLVAWVGGINIFHDFKSIDMKQTLPTYGFGVRWEFKPRVNVRVDWGFTKTGNSIVFNIGEAF